MIRVKDFHKAYDETIAVKGLNFEVAPGSILGLIGPNGAGKTTTLRTLSGIIPPSRGQLSIAGHDLASEPLAAKRRLAYIPDDPQLFQDLTVSQHLAFAAAAYQVPDSAEKIERLLESFQLTQKLHTPVSDLSRGMKQKLAVCAAYLHEPLAIFFDEPLTGLDPHGIRALKESILQRAAAGSAVIISSHLLAMVEDICTHVLILSRGEQRYFGPIDAVRTEYAQDSGTASLEEVFFRATELVAAAM
ncbi:MAG: ABC transporter ATP-binding protein [Planctomycetales bacterium]|nr:ABC transporter ATP-binding protein [Planctomycetales bacterium]